MAGNPVVQVSCNISSGGGVQAGVAGVVELVDMVLLCGPSIIGGAIQVVVGAG